MDPCPVSPCPREPARRPAATWRSAAVVAVIAALASLVHGVVAQAADEPPAVIVRGTLALPERAVDGAGNDVVIAGLSGICRLGDDRYAAVMDNSDRLLLFRLALSADGKPLAVDDARVVTLAERHDYEDVVPCPADLAATLLRHRGAEPAAAAHVLVCEEDTPAIRCFSLADGRESGGVPLPVNLRGRRPNRGLEALAIDADGRFVWTANEEALPADGPPAAQGGGTVVRLTRIPLPAPPGPAAATGPPPARPFQAAYGVDPVHPFVPIFRGEPLSGVVALVPLEQGRLLVLERSGAPGLPPFSSRIYLADVAAAADVSAVDGDLSARGDALVVKRLLFRDSLGVNLEGLCAGPRLADGSLALVGVADNGGLGTPSQLVGLALAAGRFTSP